MKKITIYKLRKVAYLALKNSIRLHQDSVLLYKHKSYPSARQLSILAMEELGKAKELENYYFQLSGGGMQFDPDEEEKYFRLFYSHPWKEGAAIFREMMDFSPKYIELVEKSSLEIEKQRSTYVGMDRIKGKVNLDGRIRSPFSISESKAKQQISLMNDILLEICYFKLSQNGYFSIEEMDELIKNSFQKRLRNWKSRSGIKSKRWLKVWNERFRKTA